MIRLGEEKDIESIISLTVACAHHMTENRIYQWNEFYPNVSVFKKDIERKELFVIEHNDMIVGCIVISELMDEEYLPVKWLTPNTNNIYVHRLAIHPSYQGNGYAQKLMTFAEKMAIDNNYTSIRLDTFSQNKRNQKFYELRGYKKLGDIYFPRQSEFPFHCYELVL